MQNIVVICFALIALLSHNTGATKLRMFPSNKTESGVWNSSCGMTCDMFMKIGPPPDLLLTIPPPPFPSSFEMGKSIIIPNMDDKCNLCDWALTGAEIPIQKRAGLNDTSWIIIAVVVSILSAIVVFAIIVMVLHCYNIKIFHKSGKCLVFGSSSSKKPSNNDQDQVSPKIVRKEQVKPLVHLWQQGFGRTGKPLQTSSSQCSEANSYSCEPYRCESIDSQHIYSEINVRSETSSTIYSEVADPPPPLPPVLGPIRRLLSDGSYENAAFNTSESQSEPFQGGSLKLPRNKKPRSESQMKNEDVIRQESPYYYKHTDHQLPPRKPLPLLPSQRMRTLPRKTTQGASPPSPAMV